MTRYASKIDGNHAAIRDGLKATFGPDAVQDVARYAGLGFDLIIAARGVVRFLEVKRPGQTWRLSDSESAARERYGNHWRCVTTLEEALEAVEP